jgi:hypothetical protein
MSNQELGFQAKYSYISNKGVIVANQGSPLTNSAISWTAILAGAIVGFGLNFLLNFLGLALGLSIFTEKIHHTLAVSMSGSIAFILVAVISMFSAGWVAGRLTQHSLMRKTWGIVYGFISWSILLIMTVILITNMIQFSYFHTSFTSKELTGIRITNQQPMLTEAQSVNADIKNKTITLNAQITFLIFLLGASSSCIGGYLGYRPASEEEK